MKTTVQIGNRRIGPGCPVYLIAEMSANHHGDFEKARELLRAARDAGADALKLQTYTADTLTIDCGRPEFQIEGGPWDGRSLYDLYGEAHTPWEWQPRLKQEADELGLDLFSTPFDATAVEFLEDMQVPVYKIASFELVDTALLERIAATGKPVIMSTGLANLAEIHEAVQTLTAAGVEELVLLKCTSSYPASPANANLRTIPHLAATFGLPVGLSDHSLGTATAVAAVSLGACVVEKHLTLSRAVAGPDSAFSMEPAEFASMAADVRIVEQALGGVQTEPTEPERANLVFRRSLFAVADIAAGAELTAANVRSIRPGYGLPPKYLPVVLGRRAASDIARGTPLSWDLVSS